MSCQGLDFRALLDFPWARPAVKYSGVDCPSLPLPLSPLLIKINPLRVSLSTPPLLTGERDRPVHTAQIIQALFTPAESPALCLRNLLEPKSLGDIGEPGPGLSPTQLRADPWDPALGWDQIARGLGWPE